MDHWWIFSTLTLLLIGIPLELLADHGNGILSRSAPQEEGMPHDNQRFPPHFAQGNGYPSRMPHSSRRFEDESDSHQRFPQGMMSFGPHQDFRRDPAYGGIKRQTRTLHEREQSRRPSPRPEPRPEPRPNPRPEPRPESRPNPRPEPRPESRPNPRPEPRPISRPEPRPERESFRNPQPHDNHPDPRFNEPQKPGFDGYLLEPEAVEFGPEPWDFLLEPSNNENGHPEMGQEDDDSVMEHAGILRGRSRKHPSKVPKFTKYYIMDGYDGSPILYYPKDLRGRPHRHPRTIKRFRKYFPRSPKKCHCKYPENPLNQYGEYESPDLMQYARGRDEPDRYTRPGSPIQFPNQGNPDHQRPDKHPINNIPNKHQPETSQYNSNNNKPNEPEYYEDEEPNIVYTTEPAFNKCPTKPNYKDPETGKLYLITSLSRSCGKMRWYDALDFCQGLDLQAVSLDSEKSRNEKEDVLNLADQLNIDSFWTSGYVVHNKEPNGMKTLTWTSKTMVSIEDVEAGTGFWSVNGPSGNPQPDNYNASPGDPVSTENCVAVLNNKYNDGIVFHDERCLVKHPVICEKPSQMKVSYIMSDI